MPSDIWNEGRVVGYSAYELYVKQFYSLEQPDPEEPIAPASERQWLASSLAMGSSLLLKLPTNNEAYHPFNDIPGTNDYYIDLPLPEGSKLVAANTIIASFFDGEGFAGSGCWASKVMSYGDLIPNNSTTSPEDNNVAVDGDLTISSTIQIRLENYMKILDGIIYMPKSWVPTNSTPEKEMEPDFSTTPILRLHTKGKPSDYCWILLTGFTLKSVIFGESLHGVSTNPGSNLPNEGGFLGPAVFPWSAKVTFTLPSSYAYYVAGQTSVSRSNITYSTPEDSGAGPNIAQKSTVSVTANGVTRSVDSISLNLSDGSSVTIDTTPNSAVKLHHQFRGYAETGVPTSPLVDKIGAADPKDNITWAALLAALANDQSVDILGARLSHAKSTLMKSQGSVIQGSGQVVSNDEDGGIGPYLEFGRGPTLKRFYISSRQPVPESGQAIPEGSIGIGWGTD